MKITEITTEVGDAIVNVEYDDGSFVSMTKETYDEQQAAQAEKPTAKK